MHAGNQLAVMEALCNVADLNWTDNNGHTPLVTATHYGSVDAVEMLLRHKVCFGLSPTN